LANLPPSWRDDNKFVGTNYWDWVSYCNRHNIPFDPKNMPPGVKAPWEPTSGSSWDGVVSGEQPGATSGCGDLARAGLVSGSEAQTRIPDTRSAYENRTWTARRWRSRIRLGHRAGPLTPTTALGVGHHGGLYPKGGGARGLPPSPPAGGLCSGGKRLKIPILYVVAVPAVGGNHRGMPRRASEGGGGSSARADPVSAPAAERSKEDVSGGDGAPWDGDARVEDSRLGGPSGPQPRPPPAAAPPAWKVGFLRRKCWFHSGPVEGGRCSKAKLLACEAQRGGLGLYGCGCRLAAPIHS
jgi:hypothetical protein